MKISVNKSVTYLVFQKRASCPRRFHSSELRRSSRQDKLHFYSRSISVLIYMTLILISSCTVGPDFHRPAPPAISQYTRNNPTNATISFVYGKPLPQQWWQLFHSEILNNLMNEALQDNQNLKAAQATLRQAQQNLNAVTGGQLPQVDSNLSATGMQFAPAQFGFSNLPASDFVLYNASVNVSYSLDLFGGIKRQIESYGAQTQYQSYQMKGARLALSANLSTTLFKLALLNEQINNTQAIIDAEKSLFAIAKKQQVMGGVNQLDVNNVENNLFQSKINLANLEKERERTMNQLAIYLGKAPSQMGSMNLKLNEFSIEKEIPLIIPSQLVRQRPDILAAEALLHQACAEVGVATANLYPQIDISGSGGRLATQTTWKSLSGQSWIWSIGPNISIPIFSGGTLTAQKKAAIAGFDIALANYRQTVLQGLQNVADCLMALELDNENLTMQTSSYDKTHQNLRILQQQLHMGGVSLAQLLNAQIADNQALMNKLQVESLKLSDTAALFQALGGGWW